MLTKAFQVERSDGAVIIELATGVSTLSDTAVIDEFAEFVEDLKDHPDTNIVFDFRNVPYFGSMVLETLRGVWHQIREGDGQMALCNVSDVALEVLRVSKFENIWTVHDSRDAAIIAVTGQ